MKTQQRAKKPYAAVQSRITIMNKPQAKTLPAIEGAAARQRKRLQGTHVAFQRRWVFTDGGGDSEAAHSGQRLPPAAPDTQPLRPEKALPRDRLTATT